MLTSLGELRELVGAFVEERLRTFEDRIKGLELECRRELDGEPAGWEGPSHRAQEPEKGSRAWYAEEILFAIECTRGWLEQGKPELAASEALVVGVVVVLALVRVRADCPHLT